MNLRFCLNGSLGLILYLKVLDSFESAIDNRYLWIYCCYLCKLEFDVKMKVVVSVHA